MGTSEERVWHGKHPAPTITTLDALMLHPNQGWRGTRSRLRFSTAALQRQPSRLFAVEYGVNIIRALPTFVVAALMATTAWTSTRAAERVDLLLVLATDVSGSMDKSKFGLQRSGYAAAFSNPRVIEALRGGPKRARRRRVHRMVGRFDLMRGVDGTFLVVVTFASHR